MHLRTCVSGCSDGCGRIDKPGRPELPQPPPLAAHGPARMLEHAGDGGLEPFDLLYFEQRLHIPVILTDVSH